MTIEKHLNWFKDKKGIFVEESIHKRLLTLKIVPQESFSHVIKRLLDEHDAMPIKK